MEIRNHEYYVSFEIANLLKKAGFDWELETCYIGKSVRPYKYHKFFNWNKPRKDFEKDGSDNLFHAFITQKKTNSFISAPTLEVAQRWLREVKGLHINVDTWPGALWRWIVWKINPERRIVASKHSSYKTYEEALESGIYKALEIILEEVE